MLYETYIPRSKSFIRDFRNSLLRQRPRISNPMSAEVCIGTKRTKLVRESREGLGPSLVPSRPIREGTSALRGITRLCNWAPKVRLALSGGQAAFSALLKNGLVKLCSCMRDLSVQKNPLHECLVPKRRLT